jgi:hypothetical protein
VTSGVNALVSLAHIGMTERRQLRAFGRGYLVVGEPIKGGDHAG